MKYIIILMLYTLVSPLSISQSLTSTDLLLKSIQYHDPDSRWHEFNGVLIIDQLAEDNSHRGSRVATLNLPKSYFKLVQTRGKESIIREIEKEKCLNRYNGSLKIDDDIVKKHQLTCDGAKMYRDYYSYLYGLPMKLKDQGTVIHPEVIETNFQGQNCYSIKVTYEKDVGEDIWYFYFDKSSYAMIGYQFYHDESKNDGEYIILKNEITIEGIKMPKDRYWYTNDKNKFLGADLLKKQQ